MQNISQVPTPSGCCGKTHAKIFEILLIVGFSASVAILVVNLVLTMFIFKYSDIIFFSEIGIASLNFICIIFSIILRVWRSNGSVLDLHYSSSNAISIIILVIIILNLICSLGEDVLYYFIVPLLTWDEDDPVPSEMIQKISKKIFNKDLDYVEEDFEKKKMIFKILPYASASFSALVQIISMIFIILIRKRIKYKSDFGIVSNIIQTQALQQSSQNKMSGNNTNLGLGSNNKTNNIYEGNAKDVKTKKSKKKKKSKDEDNGMVVPDSDQIEIMTKKKKKAKKGKKKKNKSKDKKGKMN
jgi:hypothetical protein